MTFSGHLALSLFLAALCCAGAISVGAQDKKPTGTLPAAPAPPAVNLPAVPLIPDSHVLDESGMLPEATVKLLSARLLSCQTRTGLGLYLAIHTYLMHETADIRASRTHAAWLEGKGAGIVVVHDRSDNRLTFAGSDDKRLPDADGLKALYRLSADAGKRLPPEATATDRVVATMVSLAEGLESWQKNGRLPTVPAFAKPAPPEPSGPDAFTHLKAPWTRPDGFLVDEAGVYTDPAAATAFNERLATWHHTHGLKLYVVTVTYPPGGIGLPLAEKLALEWLAEDMGGIIVFDRSQPEILTFAGTPQVDRWLSPVQLKSLHAETLTAALAAGAKPDSWITAAADHLTAAYVRDGLPLLRESQQWLPQNKRKILPPVLAGVVICATLLYLFQRWQERADRRRRTVFRFPEVFVPERLGAPHGGGVVAESTPAPPNGGVPTP